MPKKSESNAVETSIDLEKPFIATAPDRGWLGEFTENVKKKTETKSRGSTGRSVAAGVRFHPETKEAVKVTSKLFGISESAFVENAVLQALKGLEPRMAD